MTRWRLAVGLLLFFFVGVPLVWPLASLLHDPGALGRVLAGPRLAGLALNSAILLAGTLALTLPAGIGLAFLLYRTDVPGRTLGRWLIFCPLFVPLPLFTAGWQPILSAGFLWGRGLAQAVFIHSVAALPWVVLLVGQGFLWVERELEENALLDLPPWRVVLRVSLPRAGLATLAAVLWVSVQTTGEITVTDVFQVRTLAEEVYTQLVAPEIGGADVLAGALVVSLVGVIPQAIVIVWLIESGTLAQPPAEDVPPARIFPLGPWRWPLSCAAALLLVFLLAVPVTSLLSRAGQEGSPLLWSTASLLRQLRLTTLAEGRMVVESVLVAGVSGALCAVLALLICWTCLDAPRYRLVVFGVLAVAWVMPGPVLGLSFKGFIPALLRLSGDAPIVTRWLWYGPSYLPLIWIHTIRFLPCATILLWPTLRLVPCEWRDLARVDGATAFQELRYLFAPLSRPGMVRAGQAVLALALGELSAGKLAATPGASSYAMEVFAQMHYGVTPSLAAQCLLLLAVVTGAAFLVATASRGR